jgi:hypothetical protein
LPDYIAIGAAISSITLSAPDDAAGIGQAELIHRGCWGYVGGLRPFHVIAANRTIKPAAMPPNTLFAPASMWNPAASVT